MGVPRSLMLTSAMLIVPLGLSGCGLESGGEPKESRVTVEEAEVKSRERVQAYLDAMKAKDSTGGRSQMCATAQKAFDESATGPSGDFAEHFTITEAAVTAVRDSEQGQQVNATVTVELSEGTEKQAGLLFTVTRNGTEWCIAGETSASPMPIAPAASPSL